MANNSLEIGKILVPDKDAANRLKRTLTQSADSASTRRNRQHFWKKFKKWCEARDASPLPAEPDTVVFYLLNQAGQEQKKSTLNNMRWAIDTTHQQHGFAAPTDDPDAKQQIKGLFRTMAEQRPEQVSGWLSMEQGLHVSHEWIYRHVYADKRRGGDLHAHLRCQKKRRKRHGSNERRGQIRGGPDPDRRAAGDC